MHGTRIGVLVDVEGGDAELRATSPCTSRRSRRATCPPTTCRRTSLDKEREIILAQAAEEKKPPEIIAKMVEGRLRKFLNEITLTGQLFVKDDKKRVRDCAGREQGEGQELRALEVGEGIEKKAADFVEEVMAQARRADN